MKSTKRSQVAEMVLPPGQSAGGSANKHANSDQWMYIVSGSGKAVIESKEIKMKAGDLLLIEAGEAHEIINTGSNPLKTFNIYAPPEY